jgi:thiamine pyrophosphokinase
MHAVIVANGEIEESARLREIWQNADLRLAADGGAGKARARLGLPPQIVIGDLDSLDAVTRAWCEDAGAEFVTHLREKNETDLELALALALQRGATEITVLGALGGRLDQELANVFLLTKSASARVVTKMSGANFDAWVATARTRVHGRVGEIVSLIPLTARVEGISTEGLKYPLHDETLYQNAARGISNELIRERAEIAFTRGLLLIVHLFDLQSVV